MVVVFATVVMVWPEGFEPSSPAWRTGILAVGRRPQMCVMCRACARVRWTPGRDFHPRDTVCGRAPRSSATGRWLPGTDLNRRLPGNSRTSCRSTTWHGWTCHHSWLLWQLSTATGNRTPISGLRARCPSPLDHRGLVCGSGATRTPKGATPTCFRDRLLIQPDHFRLLFVGCGGWSRTNIETVRASHLAVRRPRIMALFQFGEEGSNLRRLVQRQAAYR